MKRKVIAIVATLVPTLLAFTSAVQAQPVTQSFAVPRDGYIHMTFEQLQSSFNANAKSRGLPIRLVETTPKGSARECSLGEGLMIWLQEDVTRQHLAHISMEGFVLRKKYKRKDRVPFDMTTFLQYIDCFVQTVEPYLTPQERTAVVARTGLLRFSDPVQFPPYVVKFEHNAVEYLVICKREQSLYHDVFFSFMMKGSSVEPPPALRPPQRPEDTEIIPGATKNE